MQNLVAYMGKINYVLL